MHLSMITQWISGCLFLALVVNSAVVDDKRWHHQIAACQQTVTSLTQTNTTSRLALLRQRMRDVQLSAYVIPMDDAHQSEYVSSHHMRITFISGFSGSAGTAVVTLTGAALWTDGRYFLQTEMELDCNWILMKQGLALSIENELKLELAAGESVGVDPSLVSYDRWNTWEKSLELKGISLQAVELNLVDEVWKEVGGRPAHPSEPIFSLPMKFAGLSWQDKLIEVHLASLPSSSSAMVVTALDEIAWLFNLRGADIKYCPVFFSFCIIQRSVARLYLYNHTRKLNDDVMTHLNVTSEGKCASQNRCLVEVRDYSSFMSDLRQLSGAVAEKIWVSPMSSYAVFSATGNNKTRLHIEPSAIRLMKSKKNAVEIEGMRKSHKRDSAVLVEFVTMLEREVKKGQIWTEVSAANELDSMRSRAENSRGVSFRTISGSGPNGAVIHYCPSPSTDRNLTTSEMYLLDSGGQYLDGTTDVTRTFHFGSPTATEKEAYTRVLMGAIDLANTIWPSGVYGREIDAIARRPLWQVGWTYAHGTGHGIGMFLNVHEDPANIRSGHSLYDASLQPGMFLSDEPGFYMPGKFGVRLETILMVKEVYTKYTSTRQFLGFEVITLFPFESKLIQTELLSKTQVKWLNDYNLRIIKEVAEHILLAENKMEAYGWIMDRTKPISYMASSSTSATKHSLYLNTIAIVTLLCLLRTTSVQLF